MGYYSAIAPFKYRTNLTESEFEAEKNRFIGEYGGFPANDHDRYYAKQARYYADCLHFDRESQLVVFKPDETWNKFYDAHLLAELVSRTIAPGESVEIHQYGEDLEAWGWRVERGKVVPLERIEAFVPEDETETAVMVTEFNYDRENATLRFKLPDGTRIKAIVTEENDQIVTLVPNWFPYHILKDYLGKSFEEDTETIARKLLELAEENYGDYLAEETASLFWRVMEEVDQEHWDKVMEALVRTDEPDSDSQPEK